MNLSELEACSKHLVAAAGQAAQLVPGAADSCQLYATAMQRKGWDVGVLSELRQHLRELPHELSIREAPVVADAGSNKLQTTQCLAFALLNASGWHCQAATVNLAYCLAASALGVSPAQASRLQPALDRLMYSASQVLALQSSCLQHDSCGQLAGRTLLRSTLEILTKFPSLRQHAWSSGKC